jgi:hypothetical protein
VHEIHPQTPIISNSTPKIPHPFSSSLIIDLKAAPNCNPCSNTSSVGASDATRRRRRRQIRRWRNIRLRRKAARSPKRGRDLRRDRRAGAYDIRDGRGGVRRYARRHDGAGGGGADAEADAGGGGLVAVGWRAVGPVGEPGWGLVVGWLRGCNFRRVLRGADHQGDHGGDGGLGEVHFGD